MRLEKSSYHLGMSVSVTGNLPWRPGGIIEHCSPSVGRGPAPKEKLPPVSKSAFSFFSGFSSLAALAFLRSWSGPWLCLSSFSKSIACKICLRYLRFKIFSLLICFLHISLIQCPISKVGCSMSKVRCAQGWFWLSSNIHLHLPCSPFPSTTRKTGLSRLWSGGSADLKGIAMNCLIHCLCVTYYLQEWEVLQTDEASDGDHQSPHCEIAPAHSILSLKHLLKRLFVKYLHNIGKRIWACFEKLTLFSPFPWYSWTMDMVPV